MATADATGEAACSSDIDALAGSDLSPRVAAVARGRRHAAAGRRADGGARTRPAGVPLRRAPRTPTATIPTGVDPDDLVVHQQDVQSVVNALWAGGAEAMTIMDQRVVTTSAVRCIGNTLLLQGRAYSPPFVITAIGDPAPMSTALDAEPGVALFQTYVQKYQLGFSTSSRRRRDAAGLCGPRPHDGRPPGGRNDRRRRRARRPAARGRPRPDGYRAAPSAIAPPRVTVVRTAGPRHRPDC